MSAGRASMAKDLAFRVLFSGQTHFCDFEARKQKVTQRTETYTSSCCIVVVVDVVDNVVFYA
jgi:hypothetical protein